MGYGITGTQLGKFMRWVEKEDRKEKKKEEERRKELEDLFDDEDDDFDEEDDDFDEEDDDEDEEYASIDDENNSKKSENYLDKLAVKAKKEDDAMAAIELIVSSIAEGYKNGLSKLAATPEEKAEIESLELDKMFKEAITKPDKAGESLAEKFAKAINKPIEKPIKSESKKEEKVEKVKEEMKPVEEKREETTIIPPMPKAEGINEVEEKKDKDVFVVINNNKYSTKINNDKFEKFYPRLNVFTECVKALGNHVFYTATNYLVFAKIFNKDLVYIKDIIIDPCIIYGDTIRIIDTTGVADFRQSTFVPISQKELVKKVINNTLEEKDREYINNRLSKFMQSINGDGYTIIDVLDLSGLKYDDGRKNGMPFDQWIELIDNAYNAALTTPGIRYRISNYESPKKFELVCDNMIKFAYESPIKYDQRMINAMSTGKKLTVDIKDTATVA